MTTVIFLRKIELYFDKALQYTVECKTKEQAAFIKKHWLMHDSKPNVKIIKYSKSVEKRKKLLTWMQFFEYDEKVMTLWLPAHIAYYLRTFWCLEDNRKVIETEYIHQRWPTNNFTKRVLVTNRTKEIKGL